MTPGNTPLRAIRIPDELWEAFKSSLPPGETASNMIRKLMAEWLETANTNH